MHNLALRNQSNSFKDYIERIPIWLLPLLLAILFFLPVKELTIPTDGFLYLSQALGLYEGYGYINPDGSAVTHGRIGLPALLAASFWLFGFSTFSAFIITRLFFVFTPLLLYFLGERLFNKWVGLVASLLVLTSVSLNEWATYIHLDHIMPFFMLLFLLLVFIAFNQESFRWFALAGLALGLAAIVKEVGLLFVPLPAISWVLIKEFRTRRNFWGIIISIGMLGLIIVPMFAYSHIVSASSEEIAITGSVRYVGNQLSQDSSITSSAIWRYLQVFPNYYTEYLIPNFALAPLMVVSWGFIFVIGIIRRNKSYLFICITALLLVAIVIFQGVVGFRERQSIIIFLLSYLILADFLIEVGTYLYHVLVPKLINPGYRWLAVSVGALPVVIAIFFQTGVEEVKAGTMSNFMTRYNTIQSMMQNNDTWPPKASYGAEVQPVGKWLLDHAPQGSHVLTDLELQAAIYFYSLGKFPIYRQSYPDVLNILRSINQEPTESGSDEVPRPLFFWFRTNQAINLEHRQLYVMLEKNLLDDIEENSIDYVIITPTLNFLELYYLNHPGFLKVADFDGAIQIFKVIDPQPLPFPFIAFTEAGVPPALQQIREEFPSLYGMLTEDFLAGYLGWNSMEGRQFVDGNHYIVRTGQRIQAENHLKQWRSHSSDVLAKAITLYRQRIAQYPDNPWLWITLGTIYLAKEDNVEAIAAYQHAVKLSSNNPQVYFYLAEGYTAQGNLTNDSTLYRQSITVYQQVLALAPHNLAIQEAIMDAISAREEEYLEQDLLTDLISLYEQIIDLNPNNALAYWALARIYNRSGQTDKAINIYEEIVTHYPNRAATAYLFLGQAYATRGKINEAIAVYEATIKLRPDLTKAYTRLGNFYQSQKMTKEAITLYQTAIANNPGVAWPHLELGKLYLEQAKSP